MSLSRWQVLLSLVISGLLGAFLMYPIAYGAVHVVQEGDDLQAILTAAQPGDTVQLTSGQYEGQFVIEIDNLTLIGPEDHRCDPRGTRKGRTLWVKSEDVTVRYLTVTNSGLSLSRMDAGIFLEQTAHRALVEHNQLINNLVGVYVWGPHNALVQHNHIIGTNEVRMSERGNGVTIWNSPGSRILNNDISLGRDGTFSLIPVKKMSSPAIPLETYAMGCIICTPMTVKCLITFQLIMILAMRLCSRIEFKYCAISLLIAKIRA